MNTEVPATPRPTVFLSYASEDRRAAQLIRDALPDYGLEVWYDESDLVGGDAWDQKIRRQIRECDYFMPVISAHTEARHEGYFRREWRLAVERTLDMADDHVFLLPVVIDQTTEAGARVPEKFRAVQWLRLPEGRPTAALAAVCRRLLSGEPAQAPAPAPPGPPGPSGRPGRPSGQGLAPERQAPGHGSAPQSAFPAFPHEEPGQRIRFGFQVAGWALQSAWIGFKRLPRWVRIGIYIWAAIVLMSRGCSSPHDHSADGSADRHGPPISATQAEKLRQIAQTHQTGNWTAADTAHLIAQVAKELPAEESGGSSADAPVLAIPFASPADDSAAQKLAGSVFAQVYGRLAIANHGKVALADHPLPALDPTAAQAQARAHDSNYIVYGGITGSAPNQQLAVSIVEADDATVLWSKSYAAAGADPTAIAADVSANIRPYTDD